MAEPSVTRVCSSRAGTVRALAGGACNAYLTPDGSRTDVVIASAVRRAARAR